MQINGEMVIGQRTFKGTAGSVQAINPASNAAIGPDFGLATGEDTDAACALAQQAFDTYRSTTPEQRAAFLEAIAQNILDLGPQLIDDRANDLEGIATALQEAAHTASERVAIV